MIPTQVKYPLRAALRTGAAALLAVATITPLAWAFLFNALTKAGIAIPPSITSFMATVLAAFVAVTAIFTRIMAIPQVAELMTRVMNGGPEPRVDYDPKYDLEEPVPGTISFGEHGPEFTAGDI